ncbi:MULTISPECIES: hypothetical protein [unclassified Streptomyces]|uniref:hypothetical protein n=1 Tax=unclassified Streptomyces TaxID=2593676 RepID=UPI00114CC0DC|nr:MULTISPECIES: hypothetical protein [unclassified Streptomyces]MYQ88027.1 hypothetical protein [Streptomyces sp. SID4936]
MRYLHSIETTEAADFPAWQAVALADEPEEHDGTAADYGRDVLAAWIYDTDAAGITDEDGRPLLRVRVAFADDPDAFASNSDSDVAAIVECDQLAPPGARDIRAGGRPRAQAVPAPARPARRPGARGRPPGRASSRRALREPAGGLRVPGRVPADRPSHDAIVTLARGRGETLHDQPQRQPRFR